MPTDDISTHADEVATKRKKIWFAFKRAFLTISFALLAGMSLQRSIEHFRSGASNYKWISGALLGVASLAIAIAYIMQREDMPRPRTFFEWLYERDKPPVIFDKKDN